MKTVQNKLFQWFLTLWVGAYFGLYGSLSLGDTYPNKAIKFVIPFPAGSATDSLGRIVAQAMADDLGQAVTVENKAGANGILGAEQVKIAPADGYTFLVTTSTTQAANVSLYKSLSYDPVKDFTPIGKIGVTGFILMVKPDFPAKDLKEFLAYAKANPGKIYYGHGSSGSWVSGALLAQQAGLEVTAVPYKGIPQALTDLLSGQIQFAFADVGNAVAQMEGGTLRGLAITTKSKAFKAPLVPPINTLLKDYLVSAWFGLMAPANLPENIHKRVSASLEKVLKKPEVVSKINGIGIDMEIEDSATLGKTIVAEIQKWKLWVRAAGITPE
ncbi:MAG: tripartite tricarboxylate transporter substrate binding protein [Gammaproteobacteria bacterium]|nr:tripartite tricarboxylate transporter substrate binding protein [Gammaproteobacteria bacterium]